ncbi:MAG TPA: 2TM domain-containing protein [Acidimicrobiia bacterium]
MDTSIHSDLTVEKPEDQTYQQARKRAEMIQGLYIHILVYVIFNAGLFALNWATRGDDGSWWFWWPLVIWGAGLLFHVLATIAPIFSPDWADRRAQQILSKRD